MLSALKDSADKDTAVPLLGKHMVFTALEARSRACGSGVENLTLVPSFIRHPNPSKPHLISSPHLSYLCNKEDKQILSAYIHCHNHSIFLQNLIQRGKVPLSDRSHTFNCLTSSKVPSFANSSTLMYSPG